MEPQVMERRGVDLPHFRLACLASASRSVDGETLSLGLLLRIRITKFLWVFDCGNAALGHSFPAFRSWNSGDEPAAQRRAAEQFLGPGVAGRSR
jgi:hypothetical protein